MTLYLVYRAPRDLKDRSLIPKRLRSLGCTPLRRSLWKVEKKQLSKVLKILAENRPILLKRIREIQKPQIMKEGGVPELGSLVMVTYRLPKDADRGKVRRLLLRAPCIRLCRSVYAFPQNQTRLDKSKKLVDAHRFSDFIQEMGGNVRVVTRVVVANPRDADYLLQETRERFRRRLLEIVKQCKSLYSKVYAEGSDPYLIQKKLTELKKRYVALKNVANFYEKWLGINLSKDLLKPYRAIKKVHHAIIKK
jgi:hypothetical protein